ncbi:alpha-1,6-mannosyl-glycoprotein 2-beta-N-acetylglucosaminyltransferase-like isoform X2 [Panulirus ornatus]|uniref:alpha-1,6-mannosyl-glycoprotein 2-beta-N-acetylglucosaminyltransferase-like isoform X2 n=1 Tax=Panulirus ornatus TaxID=150431 RepID=UPI003A84FDC3
MDSCRMRWRRSVRRLLVALMFLCMTVKIRLELRLLDSSSTTRDLTKDNTTYLSDNALVGKSGGAHLKAAEGPGANRYIQNSVRQKEPASPSTVDEKSSVSVAPKHNSSLVNENSSKVMKDSVNNTARATGSRRPPNVHTGPQNRKGHTSFKKDIFAKLGISVDSDEMIKDKSDSENMKASTKSNESITKKETSSERKINEKPRPIITRKPVPSLTPAVENSPAKGKESPLSRNLGKPIRAKEVAALIKHKHPPAVSQRKVRGSYTSTKRGVSHEVDSTEVSLTKEAIAKIKTQQETENEQQRVYNEERYGQVLSNTSILLVQVHNRLENLRYLVESMRKVRGLQEALVIFSHDLWDPAINAFVRNITEFRVMQIFFPFSIQLHPFSYPGRDPRDCSWNVNRREGLRCLNQRWPDSYGHYREAAFTQIKHHWWWKIHRVFEGLRITRTNYTGHVVFLEEDHYVSPDLLHALALLQRSRATLCPACQVLALGNYNKLSTTVYKNYVERGDWWVTKHNLGFALDAAAWKTLATCKSFFCDFDDYNWDWTLNTLVQTCLKPRISMLSTRFSRVVHVGSCGTHVKKKSCDVRKEVQAAINRFSSGKQWLFPDVFRLQNVYRSSGKTKKGNGGWGDFRDRQLCRAIGNGTATEDILARLQLSNLS